MRPCRAGAGGQRGAVLGIGLLFLLVMTLLGTALMQSTTMQERMAGGVQDRNRALQAAETALNVAEAWMLMHLLERAAQAQMRASAAHGGQVPAVDDALAALTQAQWLGDGSQWDGDLEWPALLRRVSRLSPGFDD